FSEIHFKRIIKDLVKPTNKAILNDLEAEKTIKDINDSRKANNQPLLNKDQQKAVYKGLTSKSNAFLISAFAGTGKTTATLKPIVDNFVKATKGNVYTATVANLPANILKEEVNADTAYNTTTLINGLKSGKIQLTKNDLVILDEVSMIGLKDNLTICDEIVKSKARIVFVGDYEQLHSITSQSSMRILLDSLDESNVGNLSHVVRQKDKEQANTVELISKGDIDNALISIEKNKQANFFDSQIDCMASLSNDFINLTLNHPEQKTTAYAYRIDDIIEMNNLIADGLKNNNLIDKNVFKAVYETTKDDFGSSKKYDIELYKKETVIFKETFYDKDKNKIANGQQGQIVDINGSVLSIKLADSDKVVDVDTRKYQKLLPSMCMSIYASQGATTGNSLVLADETYNRKLALIGISRGQLQNNIYVNGDKETLEDILNKVVEKENLLDTATTEE
ncbi:MAG: AAA family ATPase, partial [Parvibaculum sp.]|nr:AAA family ATPase [Parvibaculum sp.]